MLERSFKYWLIAATLGITLIGCSTTAPSSDTPAEETPPEPAAAEAPRPQIDYEPSSLTVSFKEGEQATPVSLHIWSANEVTATWQLTAGVDWLECTPSKGASTGERDEVTVRVDTTSMGAGTYDANLILIIRGALGGPTKIPVHVTIEPEARPAIMSDDFSDESSGWDTFSDETGDVRYCEGQLRVKARTDAEYSTDSFYLQETFGDFSAEVETTLVEGTTDNWHTFYARSQVDPYGRYVFAISADGFYMIGREEEVELVDLVGPTRSRHIETGVGPRNVLRVECMGDTLRLWANDHKLAEVEDSSFTSGYVGLGATAWTPEEGKEFTDIAFDDLVIREA